MAEQDAASATKRCPIDFDHDSHEHALHWEAEFRDLRERCPRPWTDNHGGFWVATKYADIVRIAQRTESFSTHKDFDPATGEPRGGLAIPAAPMPRAVPNETDSPEWDGIRGFINRRFAPRAVEERRAEARRFAAALIDLVIEKGEFDIVDDLTSPLPALVTMAVFGFPLGDWRKFADPFHKMVYTPISDPSFRDVVRGLDYFRERVDEEIDIRLKTPADDLLGYMASGTIDGQPLDRELIQDLAFNILAGGLDTTTALTSSTLLHLSRNPALRRRLIDEPALMPLAREEYLRFVSPIHALARNAKEDVEVDGWQFEKGDRVLLAYASGNRDPDAFDDPEEVKLDRYPNKHMAFGVGQHRCIGSFLARMMFEVMVNEVLTRMPDFNVVERDVVQYTRIGVNGWVRIPATFAPGPKVGATID